MNIFFHELRACRKSTIIWTLSLIGIMVLYMSIFPSFAKDTEEFTKILQGYPEGVRRALGLNLGNFFTILGFYCFPLTFITLCGAIQAMNLGTSIISKEVREKTADFLLTKPVTRSALLTAKLAAVFTSIVITNIVYIAAASLMVNQVKTEDYSYQLFLFLSLTLFFVQLIFLAIGIIFSVIIPRIKSVLAVSLPTVFAFYFLGMLSTSSDEEAKRFLSPFKYFDTSYIMKHSGYETPYLATSAAIIVIAVAASFLIYARKDIHAV
jgi:ABC-2 type transport system permease protein